MSVRRIYRGNFALQSAASSAWHLIMLIVVCWWGASPGLAQGQSRPALITGVKGIVTLERNVEGNPRSFTLKYGDSLQMGDIIDTRAGSVVIAMPDGSQITIYSQSHVRLKDFHPGASLRDLLEVVVGQVRAKISHQLKRPNPYRVYSPIASIAVRGTEFLVSVESNTETRVLVFEGLVEVSSLVNPQKAVLVKPGRNVVVRPDGDISLVTSAPRGELNEIRNSLSPDGAYHSHDSNDTEFRPTRFTAFSDSHLDSLQNPAYATEFRQSSGRLYLIPSFSPQVDETFGSSDSPFKLASPFNYTLSPQLSYFVPLGSKMVVGGGTAVTKTDLHGNGTDGASAPQNGITIYHQYDGTTKFTTANLSLMAARRFGQAERTSLGIKFDYLSDLSLLALDTKWSTKTYLQLNRDETRLRRIGLSVGLTHDFGDDKKLGIYYRYGQGPLENSYRETILARKVETEPYSSFSNGGKRTGSDSISEAGARVRGSLTQRLFYGVEGSMLSERAQQVISSLHEDRRTKRATLSAGVGYALRPRTVLSIDLSAGLLDEHFQSKNFLFDGIAENHSKERSYFQAIHGGVQTDLWRNFFAGASMALLIHEDRHKESSVYPKFPDQSYSWSSTNESNFSNFTAGWRITPRWVVQYVYFPSYSYSTTSHSVIIRHEFGGKKGTGEMSGIKP